MNNDLDIFVFSHKTPSILPDNEAYKVVCLEKDNNKIDKNLNKIVCCNDKENIFNLEHAYSEGSRIHYIWKNIPLKKYIGTAHYRRYFDFMEDIPNLDELFNTYDIILPKFNLGWSSIKGQYANSHNIEDLEIIENIIKEDYPDYYETALSTLNNGQFRPCNIFIMKSDMFYKYCEFVFGVLEKYNNIMHFNNDIDVFNYVLNNIPKYCENKSGMLYSINYQARIQAFLMERISNIFYNKNFKNPYLAELVLTEQNFEIETEFFKLYEK
jgi:hypothetical protein